MRRLIGSTLFLLASAGWATAALGPLEAAAILAEAKAANAKCKVLNATETDNLSLFTARAEVAAVSSSTPDEAAPQLQQAQARGRASTCDATAKADIREIYDAASEAMEAVNREASPTATGPVNILPQPLSVATIQPAPRPIPLQAPTPLVQPQPRPQPQPLRQPQVLAPAPAPAPAPVPVPVPTPAPRQNFAAQQPQLPQAKPRYVYAEPAPAPVPQPQYVYAQPQPVPQYAPEPAPEPQPIYAAPAPAPAPVPEVQYAYAQAEYAPPQPQPQPQPIVNERFLARFSVVLERPEPQPIVYQTPVAVYAPEPVYAPVADVAGGLEHYARRASAYYVEIRCQHLSPQQAQQFWQSIAAEHATMLERESPSAIEAALAQSRAQADNMACSSQSAQFVQQAFQGF